MMTSFAWRAAYQTQEQTFVPSLNVETLHRPSIARALMDLTRLLLDEQHWFASFNKDTSLWRAPEWTICMTPSWDLTAAVFCKCGIRQLAFAMQSSCCCKVLQFFGKCSKSASNSWTKSCPMLSTPSETKGSFSREPWSNIVRPYPDSRIKAPSVTAFEQRNLNRLLPWWRV